MYKRRYGNRQKQKAYQNAIDCIYSGYVYSGWDSCGLSEWESAEVWDKALSDTENLLNRYSVRMESCMGYI